MVRNTLKSQKGFSLIELMVVVAIIGILAAIAIPNFQKFQRKAKQSEAKSQLAALYTAEKSYFLEFDSYAASLVNVGYGPDGQVRYNVGFNAQTVAVAANDPAAATNPGLYNTIALCANATHGVNCTTLAGVPALTAGDASAAAFTAQAIGNIQTAATGTDDWRIDNTKTLTNSASGL